MNKNTRLETLRNNGMDISKYFTLVVNETLPAGTKINIEVDKVNNPVAKQIIEDGYVKNTKLHRRWVAAQYMRMLNYEDGWHAYLRTFYGYMYQFDMMMQEVFVLSKLEKRDRDTFNERKKFFTRPVVINVLEDYVLDVKNHVDSLKIRHCKGRPYVNITGFGNVFCEEIDKRVINPINGMIEVCNRCHAYTDLYNSLVALKKVMVKLPYSTPKSKTWIDAFQKEGAFYTLKNLIMFHDVDLFYNKAFHERAASMTILNIVLDAYEGYEMNALLKKTIEMNAFDFKKSIEKHK
jgi:hypothetical protein